MKQNFDPKTAAFLANLITILPHDLTEEDMEKCLHDQQGFRTAIRNWLRPPEKKIWPVWKTVTIGEKPSSAQEIRNALRQVEISIYPGAEDVLFRPGFMAEKHKSDVRIALVSMADLGFNNRATFEEICKSADSLGLDLCPCELAPKLLLQHAKSIEGRGFSVAMNPVLLSDSESAIFEVRSRQSPSSFSLDSKVTAHHTFFYQNDFFIFVIR